ncbi:unnamed protein product [Nippostrongylus brasiliensis]|uniref:DUF4430 domain-containing protein n=1 Tax=Nippostrongylus brasiliensis TaxID=27835 RepID=A0A0N4YF15_NIPBR|nr:unnamed protein product [Nippostrongylus brasiliensis]
MSFLLVCTTFLLMSIPSTNGVDIMTVNLNGCTRSDIYNYTVADDDDLKGDIKSQLGIVLNDNDKASSFSAFLNNNWFYLIHINRWTENKNNFLGYEVRGDGPFRYEKIGRVRFGDFIKCKLDEDYILDYDYTG